MPNVFFLGFDMLPASEIKFGVNSMGSQIYFTSKGLTYKVDKVISKDVLKGKSADHKAKYGKETFLTHLEWIGANQNVEILSSAKVPDFYAYIDEHGEGSKMIKANAYEKIVYKNLYPNIDIEYVFHKERGIKYSLILHPGADASQVKMKYTGCGNIVKNTKGNIGIEMVGLGNIIDHAPVTFYSNSKIEITSSFNLDGNTVTFNLGQYDNSKEVIIDPWTINPAFAATNRAYDVLEAPSGDIYASGGTNPFYVKKFTPAGALVWTYAWPNGTNYYGDFVLDNAEDIYISYGPWLGNRLSKIDNNATLIFNNTTGNTVYPQGENYRLGHNPCTDSVVVGGFCYQGQITNSATMQYVNRNNGNFFT